MKRAIYLHGLNCAHCAGKIERDVQKISYLSNVSLNFPTKKLTYDSEESQKRCLSEITKIVKSHEPDVVVSIDKEQKGTNKKVFSPETLITLTLAVILGAAGFSVEIPILSTVLMIASYLLVGYKVLWKTARIILSGKFFDENFLMSIATIGAICIGDYLEAIAVMLFYRIGEYFQELAVHRSERSISELMDIRPDTANLKTKNGISEVRAEDVKIGDVIVIKPGERVPLDGKIISGTTMLDTSSLTGESVPRSAKIGNDVLSGSLNKESVIELEVTEEFANSTASKILELIENASENKSQSEKFITRFAKYYTPIIVAAALLVAVVPPMILGWNEFSDWLHRALIFLVISCPCALVISIPLSFFAGIGRASKSGLLIKGANSLEKLASLDTIVFDKTGTLTRGNFKVMHVNPENGISADELLNIASSIEMSSNHPIARSIVEAAPMAQDEASEVSEISGMGMSGRIGGSRIFIGNEKLMQKCGLHVQKTDLTGTTVYVCKDGKYLGNIVIADEIKPDSKDIIKKLKALKIKKTAMLSGDVSSVANTVAAEIGIDEVHAELLPGEKMAELEKIMDDSKCCAFVGDGINDAPSLAAGDIGIAMGGLGSDAAIEAADIVLMTDETSKIADGVRISQYTKKILIQNIILALGVKLLVMILGIFGIANMWEAVFADVGVAVLAVLNSMRILKMK